VTLKKKWQSEICKVYRSWSGEAAKAAMTLVVVVPILDPSVSG
jgi:hypothetical protein